MATVQSSVSVRLSARRVQAAVELLRAVGTPCELQLHNGQVFRVGTGPPVFRVLLRTERALQTPLRERALARAYVNGDIDIIGDLMALLNIRDKVRDSVDLWGKLRFAAQLAFAAPTTVNARAVEHHYSFGDDFYLAFVDTHLRLYSQCVFHDDEETLEAAAENKLKQMWDALGLRPGMRLLDVGGGWGGVTEYCGTRGVHVTSLTLAQDSAAYIRNLIKEKSLPGEVFVEDMLVHRTDDPYDRVVIFGVIEHIPNYRKLCERLWDCLKPAGRLYLDGSATIQKYAVRAFTRQSIYRGTHCFMSVQDVVQELLLHGFEVVHVQRETHDYYLTMRHWAERLDSNQALVTKKWGEEIYRAFRLYLWAGSHAFNVNRLQAYHLVAERRSAPGPRPGVAERSGSFVLSLR